MKKIFTLAILLLFINSGFAQQVPQGFNYQAVIRDAVGLPIVNTQVKIRLSVIQTLISGTIVYQEEHVQTTNQFGLVNLVVGKGTIVGGTLASFSLIDWASDDYFIQVEADNNNSWINLGTSQFQSVPYSLAAANALRIQNQDFSSATPLDGQFLKFNGINGRWEANNLSGANGGTVITVSAIGPLSINNNGGLDPQISIQQASIVQDGYLSSSDFALFSGKLGTSTGFSGDISGNYSAISVNRIKGQSVDLTGLVSGQILSFNGINFVPGTIPTFSQSANTIIGINGSTVIGTGNIYTVSSQNLVAGSGIQITGNQIINALPNILTTLTGLSGVTINGANNNFTVTGPGFTSQATSITGTNGVTIAGSGFNLTIGGSAQTLTSQTASVTTIGLNFEIGTASGTSFGLLKPIDWTNFNGKLSQPVSIVGVSGTVVNGSYPSFTLSGINNAWLQGGNPVSGITSFGTSTNFDLPFITSGNEALRITSAGDILINTSTSIVGARLEIKESASSGRPTMAILGGPGGSADIVFGRSASEGGIGIAGANAFFSNLASPGDIILRAAGANNNLILSAKSASGDIIFSTGLSDTPKMVVSNSGNVSITGNAFVNNLNINSLVNGMLSVDGTGRLVIGTANIANNWSVTGGGGAYLPMGIGTTGVGINALPSNSPLTIGTTGTFDLHFVPVSGGTASIKADQTLELVSDNDINLLTNGSGNIRLKILQSGEVGIGTTTPNKQLTVQGNSSISGTGYFGTIVGDNLSGANGSIVTVDGFGKLGIGTLQTTVNQWNNTTTSFNTGIVYPNSFAGIGGTPAFANDINFYVNDPINGGNILLDANPIGSPALNFSTSNDASIFTDGNDNGKLKFASSTLITNYASRVAGTRMTIDPNNGFVGIGTTSPTQQLAVIGNISVSGTGYLGTIIGNNLSGAAGSIVTVDGFGKLGIGTLQTLVSQWNNTTTSFNTGISYPNSFVGIGNSLPISTNDASLAIRNTIGNSVILLDGTTGGGSPTINFWGSVNDGAIFIDAADNGKMKFASANIIDNYAQRVSNTKMTIDPSGNVGIGTTSPNQLFTVQGNSSITGIGYFGTIIGNNLSGAPIGSIVTVDGIGKLGYGTLSASIGGSGTTTGIAYFTNNNIITADGQNFTWNGTVLGIRGSSIIAQGNATNNFFVGSLTGTTGTDNVFMGFKAGQNNTTGTFNNFLGKFSGGSNTTGISNNFLGLNSGQGNTIGTQNNFFGQNAGISNNSGSYNNFFGIGSGNNNTSGGGNIFIGSFSGANNTVGNNNISIGTKTSFLNNNYTNAIAIGAYATVGGSNMMILGGNQGSGFEIKVGVGTGLPNQELTVQGNSSITGTGYFGNIFDNNLAGSPGSVITVDGLGQLGIGALPSGSQWQNNGQSIYYNTSFVGIGTTTPNQRLTVQGNTSVIGIGYFQNIDVVPAGAATGININSNVAGAGLNSIKQPGAPSGPAAVFNIQGTANISDVVQIFNSGAGNALSINSGSGKGFGLDISMGGPNTSGGINLYNPSTGPGLKIVQNSGLSSAPAIYVKVQAGTGTAATFEGNVSTTGIGYFGTIIGNNLAGASGSVITVDGTGKLGLGTLATSNSQWISSASNLIFTNSFVGIGTAANSSVKLMLADSPTGGGIGIIRNNSGAEDGIAVSNIASSGRTASFVTGNAGNTSDVVFIESQGLGKAGVFSISNISSTAVALHAKTSGQGLAFLSEGAASVSGIGYFGTIIGNNLSGASGSIITVDGTGKLGLAVLASANNQWITTGGNKVYTNSFVGIGIPPIEILDVFSNTSVAGQFTGTNPSSPAVIKIQNTGAGGAAVGFSSGSEFGAIGVNSGLQHFMYSITSNKEYINYNPTIQKLTLSNTTGNLVINASATGIGTSVFSGNEALRISSFGGTKGLVFPYVTTVQMAALSVSGLSMADEGMLFWNTDLKDVSVWDGTQWQDKNGNNSNSMPMDNFNWNLGGNTVAGFPFVTTTGYAKIGANDNYNVAIVTNNQPRIFINTLGGVTMGMNSTMDLANTDASMAFGSNNFVNAARATAIGHFVQANHLGSMLLGDWNGSAPALTQSSVNDEYTARFNGGYRFFTNSNDLSKGIYFKTDAKIGVNVVNPQAQLQVNGDIGLGDGSNVNNGSVTIWMRNNGGTGILAGQIVMADPLNDNGIILTSSPTDGDVSAIGVAYENILPGAIGRVVVAGVTQVIIENGFTTQRGQHVIASNNINQGRAKSIAVPGPGASIGVWIESRIGDAPGTIKAKMILR